MPSLLLGCDLAGLPTNGAAISVTGAVIMDAVVVTGAVIRL
jgi:hypothetical protein